jgi:hypothetical protein
MGSNGQRHDPAALYRQGKELRYPLDRRLEEVRGKILFAPTGDRT